MKSDGLLTREEYQAQKAKLDGQKAALRTALADEDVRVEEAIAALRGIAGQLMDLRGTWQALPAPFKGRFVRILLPVGFVVGKYKPLN
jgi:hypothetical protein